MTEQNPIRKNFTHSVAPRIERSALGLMSLSRAAVFGAAAASMGLPALAQEAPTRAPTVSVEGEAEKRPPKQEDTPGDYKVDRASSPKFTEPLIDTPKTVTVIPREVIEEQGITSFKDAMRTQPGITLGTGEGGNSYGDRIIIRGFEARGDVFLDGQRDPGAGVREIFNTERVEISKGPGSSYTGRGSTGGTVNIVSKEPKAQDFIAGDVSYGNGNTKRLTADVNQNIDDMALRVNAMWHEGEIAGRGPVYSDRWGFAPSLTLGMNRETSMTFSYYHITIDQLPDYGVPWDARNRQPFGGGFYGLVNRDFQHVEADIFTARIDHEINYAMKLRHQMRLGLTTNDYIVSAPESPNFTAGTVNASAKTRNQDNTSYASQTDLTWDFATGEYDHTLVTGIEVSRDRAKNRGYAVTPTNVSQNIYNPNPYQPWTGLVMPSPNYTDIVAVNAAAYVFDTVKLNKQWQVMGGLRFDDYDAKIDTNSAATNNLGVHNRFFSWQGGVVYKPAPNGSVYLSYGTSANPSGENLDAATDAAYGGFSAATTGLDPERSVSYELGTKWDLFDGGLAVTSALFRTDKTNMRVANPGGGQNVLDGEARVQGLEVELAGKITDKWKVFGGYALLDHEILKSTVRTDIGKRLANVADHQLSLWTTYDLTPDWTFGLGAFYVSSRKGGTLASNDTEAPEYWRFDAMASYKVNQNVSLRLNVQNLFDELYYDATYRSATPFTHVAPGRTILLTSAFKF